MLPSFHYWRGDRLASQQGTYLLLHLMFTHTHTHCQLVWQTALGMQEKSVPSLCQSLSLLHESRERTETVKTGNSAGGRSQ